MKIQFGKAVTVTQINSLYYYYYINFKITFICLYAYVSSHSHATQHMYDVREQLAKLAFSFCYVVPRNQT